MGEIRVRGVDEGVIHALRDNARREGSSLSELLRRLLADAAMRPRRELIAQARAIREGMRDVHGTLDDSTPAIRAERDERG